MMSHVRRFILRLSVALVIVIVLVGLLIIVEAEEEGRRVKGNSNRPSERRFENTEENNRNHRHLLDLSDEIESEPRESEIVPEDEHLELFHQASRAKDGEEEEDEEANEGDWNLERERLGKDILRKEEQLRKSKPGAEETREKQWWYDGEEEEWSINEEEEWSINEEEEDFVLVTDDVEDENEEELVYGAKEDYEDVHGQYEELPHCQEESTQDGNDRPRPAVVVSTLDGRVTGLDATTGLVLWSHQTGGKQSPMLSSSMSKLEVTSRGEWVRLIPSLDGGIYRFDGEEVEALPVTADTLLYSSFKFNADTIFTGGKSTEVWGMAVDTGRIIYVCTTQGCKRQRTASKPTQVLVVRRVTQTVRAVDPKSGDERWNFSVGQHELNLAGGGGCEWVGRTETTEDVELPTLHFVVPDGIIMGMNAEGHLIWQQKLSSPVVNAWRLNDGDLEQVDLFSTSSVPALTPDSGLPNIQQGPEYNDKEQQQQPALYVGVHKKQLYIQQSGGMRQRVSTAARVFNANIPNQGTETGEVTFPRVQWRPYLATALSRTPVVHYNGRTHPLLLDYEPKLKEETTAVAVSHHLDYPYASQCMPMAFLLLDDTLGLGYRDNGYYLYGDESNTQPNFSRPWENPESANEDETIIDEMTAQIIHICFHIGPDIWVKLLCGIACYALLHFLLLRYILAHMQRHVTQQALALVTHMLQLIIHNNPHILALIQRLGVEVPALPPPPPPPPPQQAPPAYDDAVLPNLSEEAESEKIDSLPKFTSRYLTDFELVQRLGRGGFGVVFQVRNRLDENEYAVKRITLPSKESSAERVKREVRALAKLNHTNIVRYYNSWLETPPPGWQDESDAVWKTGDVLSTSLFSPGVDDSLEKVKDVSEKKKSDDNTEDSLAQFVDKLGFLPESNQKSNAELTEGEHGSASGYEEEEDSSSSESDIKIPSSARADDDDSFDIIFEKSSGKDQNTEASSVCRDVDESFSIEFADSADPVKIGRNVGGTYSTNITFSQTNHSYLTTQTASSVDESVSQSVVSEEGNENANNLSVERIQNISNNSSQEKKNSSQEHSNAKLKVLNRRRIQSQPSGASTASYVESERPRTLSLGTSVEKSTPKSKEPNHVPRPRTFLYIQMELCQKESLKDWLLANQSRPLNTIYSLFNDVVRAVEYVHDNQLMHRDLKPSNIFFSLDGEVKIGDFGLVTTIAEDEQEVRTPADSEPATFTSNNNHTHRVGTQLYMSPEQVNGCVYDYKVDIYSLGLIFFEMLIPFSTGMERLTVMTKLRHGDFPVGFREQFPDECELLKIMLSTNPASRPTTRGIRARKPLLALQGSSIEDIHPEDHFRLTRQRSHAHSQSSSSFTFSSSTSSA